MYTQYTVFEREEGGLPGEESKASWGRGAQVEEGGGEEKRRRLMEKVSRRWGNEGKPT